MACTGTSGCPKDEYGCGLCGCDWDYELSKCFGTADPCSNFANQGDCETCKCDWGINMKINVGDVWREADSIKINISDNWRTVTKIQINIGDTWRTIFG